MSDIILKARYVFSSYDKLIDNGVVVVNGDRISLVTSFDTTNKEQESKVLDFGNAVILPGLVNAHTHLELTNLHGLVTAEKRLISWIEGLIKAKLKWKKPDYVSSLEKGLTLSLESGTTTVADITNSGHSIDVLQDSPIRKIVFTEIINFDPSKAAYAVKTAKDKFNNLNQSDLFRCGISPHAPYTVSSELFKECAHLTELPLCTHVAETIEEVTFLIEGKGPFIDFLNRFRMLNESWKPPGLRPVKYLESTGILKNAPLLIHCNYISDDEISLIEELGLSVVYCPRSHSFFVHGDHPFLKLLDRGVNVAIGTDSLASNYSLSVLDEMKFIHASVPEIAPERILAMGTENGALALRLGDKTGKIETGYYADISVIALPAEYGADVCRGVLSKESENVFTMVAGITCFDKYSMVIKQGVATPCSD